MSNKKKKKKCLINNDDNNKNNICPWFNHKEKNISNEIRCFDFNIDNKHLKNKKFFNKINHHHMEFEKINKFKYSENKKLNIENEKQKINKAKDKAILKIKNSNKSQEKINIAIKIKKTKTKNKISRIGKIVKSLSFTIKPNEKQIKILNLWFDECDKVYNYCIDYSKKNNKKLNKSILFDYQKLKIKIFKKIYGDDKKSAPYDVLTDEVRAFSSNYKSAITNIKNGNIKFFELKHKKRKNGRSILIPKKSIQKNSFFRTLLGDMDGISEIPVDKIESDCRLIYDKRLNRYYLKCPFYFDSKKIKDREKMVALDPGEKVFMTYYSENDCGMIGHDIRKNILVYEARIRKFQRILSQNKNRNGNKLNNRKTIINKIRNNYRKIGNLVKELHNKTALYLVRNYDRVLIPKFETKQMIRNGNKEISKKKIKNKINEIKNDNSIENKKEEFKLVNRRRRLNGRVKFVLMMLSHYKFRQHLKHKCLEYGCEMKEVTEEYTSQCCGKCGYLSKNYNNRIKKCSKCNFEIERDINGSRNIFIKNWCGNYKL
jgi:putative transposase